MVVKILYTRFLRMLSNDISVPKRCNAKYYYVRNEVCDCKIWCKYPPPGTSIPLVVKNHLNTTVVYKQRWNTTTAFSTSTNSL